MNRETTIRKKQIKYINENDYNRIFVISDLHGYYELFLKFIVLESYSCYNIAVK